MKNLVRAMVVIVVASYFVIPLYLAPYKSPALGQYQRLDYLLHAYGAIYVLSYFFIWIYFIFNWSKKEFETKSLKKIWLWILVIGGFIFLIGPLLYYILVFELKKTIKAT